MEYTNTHVGFADEAPETVIWSDRSFVKAVHPRDRRKHGWSDVITAFIPLVTLFSSLGIMATMDTLRRYFPGLTTPVMLSLSGLIFFPGLLLFFFRSYLLKQYMISKLRSRGELLFEPDQSCAYVLIEDPMTYDKRKFFTEDFGLLKITPTCVQLEMMHHRAQIDRQDLTFSMLHVGREMACVRLTCSSAPHPWSIAVTVQSLPYKIFNAFQSAPRTRHVINLLQKDNQPECFVRESACPSSTLPQPPADGPGTAATTVSDPNDDIMEIRYEQVVEAIRQKEKKRKSLLANISILVISLYLFIQLGFFRMGLKGVLTIILVLFIHELGHLIGMKLFGYRNVQMFFIPLMGAAVSGVSQHVPSWKKSLVMLLGPLPGIFLSMIFMLVYLVTDSELFSMLGIMFLFLNFLNLLPFYPLDGGRFINEVLFSRNRYLELFMNVAAALVFLAAGTILNDWLLKILGFMNLASLGYRFKLATAAMRFRMAFHGQQVPRSDMGETTEIPERHLKQLINWVYHHTPGPLKPQAAAQIALQIWERVRIQPPRPGATIGLLVLFCIGYAVSFVTLAGYGYRYYRQSYQSETKIVEYRDPKGQVRYAEQVFISGQLCRQICLTDDCRFYHGPHISYMDGTIYLKGTWDTGYRIGDWCVYDPNEQPVEITHYDEGKPVLIKSLIDGQWREDHWEDLSEDERSFYEQEAEIPRGPSGALLSAPVVSRES